MIILGISAFFHDSSACILKDGRIIAAVEEERFTRKKHDTDFPFNAINYCLKKAGARIEEVDYIGFYEKPLLKFERVLSQFLESFPRGFLAFYNTIPSWITQKLRVQRIIRKKLKYKKDILFVEHHLAHAASSYLVSPFKEAAILTVDGVGEWATTTYGYGKENEIKLLKQINFPHSLGLLYSAVTAYLGFKVNNDEYKIMGLAPYGKPVYLDEFRKIMDVAEDGSYKLDMNYFVYHYKMAMPSKKFANLFGAARKKEAEITQKHKDIAASLQKFTEEVLFKMLNHLYKETGCKNLCMAGGVALNSVANGKIMKNTPFEDIYIIPAAGDGGTSVGAAAYIYHSLLGYKRNYVMSNAYFGPEFSSEEIKEYLDKNKIKYSVFENERELIKKTAEMVYKNNVVGWFQKRMEFGPRALGGRSILANPCNPKMQDILNLKVKHRECYDEKTQILTKEGWKLFKELKGNEEVATLNPKTNELEYQRIERKTEYKYNDRMIHFKNKRIDLVVTPNHNIWTKILKNHNKGHSYKQKFEFEKAINLLGKENIQIKAISRWKGKEEKYFILPKIKKSKYDPRKQINKIPMNLWLEFLGYYLSEGSFTYHGGHYGVYVSQRKKSKHYERIKKCLEKLKFCKWNYNNMSFRTFDKQFYEYLKQFGKAKDKFIPGELLQLSERQLKILFNALMCGDGTYRPKQYKYTTVSKKLADNVQEIGIKLGYSVTTSKEELNNPRHNDTYYVRLNKGSKISWIKKNQSSLVDYKGKVYCVAVAKYHLLCVKRNEKIVFSGNSFRPFAPVVCVEDAKDYFECNKTIPIPTDFMLMVYPIKKDKQKLIPAVTHVDGSGRLQTIRAEQNPLYYGIIKEFGKLSKVPILVNTSFNIRGEPIVCTPENAYRCMMGTGIDCLVMDKFLIKREDNPQDMWDSEKYAKD